MVETVKRAADARDRRTILIVEDDGVLRMVLRMVFEKNGFNVVEAENGLDGLSAIRDIAPDIIITDIQMPVMDGFAFISAVRKTNGNAAIPIIAISAMRSDDGVSEKAIEAGASRFFAKPLTPESLLTVIKSHLPAVSS